MDDDTRDLRTRMDDEVARMRTLGYRHAMVYVTPEEKVSAIEAKVFEGLFGPEVRVLPSKGSDNPRKARGDVRHEFFMAIFGEMFPTQPSRVPVAKAKPTKKSKVADVDGKPKAPSARKPAKKKAKKAPAKKRKATVTEPVAA